MNANQIKYANNKEKIKSRTKEYYWKNRENILAKKKLYRDKNKEHAKGVKGAWYKNNKPHQQEKNWAAGIKKRHGVTKEQYLELMNKQNGACAICKREPRQHSRLCIDHDHNTGEVRGLLCRSCNTGIGNLHDDPITLESAILYLKTSNLNPTPNPNRR